MDSELRPMAGPGMTSLAWPPHRVYFEGTLPSSSGLGRGPLKAETGVRFP
jgi:hypothetical protein